MGVIRIVLIVVRGVFRDRAELAAENLALRQQLAVLQQKSKRPRLRKCDRIFSVWLSRLWAGWRSVLVIVQRVRNMGIEEVLIAPRSPWQNPYAERLIGSIRRECLNHFIVLNERHLLRILRAYFDYCHYARAHLSLDRNSPFEREVEPPERGKVIAIPQVGGLHHRYRRAS